MKTLHPIDWIAFLSFIASGGLSATVAALGSALPNQAKTILIIAGVLTALAGVLVRLFANPTDAPASSIVADAPVINPKTGAAVALNVSSTSALLSPQTTTSPQGGSTP